MPTTGGTLPPADYGSGADSLLAMFVQWIDVAPHGVLPVLCVFESTADVPNDGVRRNAVIGGDGRVYQIPTAMNADRVIGVA